MMDIQQRIRQNANDQQEAAKELHDWEAQMDARENQRRQTTISVFYAEKKKIFSRQKNTKFFTFFQEVYPPIRGQTEISELPNEQELASRDKERGNDEFRKGNFQLALTWYDASLEHYDRDPTVYSNRAAVHLKLNQWKKAENDATTCIKLSSVGKTEEINKGNVKGWYRRGEARRESGYYHAALSDMESVLRMEPTNKLAAAAVKDLGAKIEAERRAKQQKSKKLLISEEDSDDEVEEESQQHNNQPKQQSPPPPAQTAPKAASPQVVQNVEAKVEAKKPVEDKPQEEKPTEEEKPKTSHKAAPKAPTVVPLPKREVRLPEEAPKSSVQFEETWQDVLGDDKVAWQYLVLKIDPLKMKVLLNTILSPEFIATFLRICALGLEAASGSEGEKIGLHTFTVARFLFNMPKADRFDEVIAFLSSKSAVGDHVNTIFEFIDKHVEEDKRKRIPEVWRNLRRK